MDRIVFRQWSNKPWAVFASLHKVIIIATLCLSYQMVAQDGHGHQSDSSQHAFSVDLEEVEASGVLPAELEEVSLKPVLLVSRKDISEAAGTSHEDLLELLPQVDIRQRGKHGTQADISIQGGSFDQGMVLLNGINLSDPQTGHFHMNLPLDLHATQRIEVLTGSASRSFGTHAFTGAVNLVTMPSDTSLIRGGLSAGEYGFYKARLQANLGMQGFRTMVSTSTSGSRGYRENTDFRTSHGYIHTEAGKGKLRAHLMGGLNRKAFGANAFYSPRFIHQYEESSTGLAALKLVLKEEKSQWTYQAYFRQNRDHFQLDRNNPAFYFNHHRTRILGSDLLGRFSSRAGITHSGLYFRDESILSTTLGEELVPGQEVMANDSVTFTNGHRRQQMNWTLNHSMEAGIFSLSGGFMMHLNSDLEEGPDISPGAELRVRLPHRLRIFASLNRSMRLPTFTDLYYQGPSNVGNPFLKPETATTLEAGIYRQHHGLHLGLNSFYRKGRNLIDWVWMEDDKWHTMNLGIIDALGGDLYLRYRARQDRSRIWQVESAEFSYTFTHLSKVSEKVQSRYVLDNLRHKLVLGTGILLAGQIRLNAWLNVQDRKGTYLAYDAASGESQEQAYDPFALLDLKLSWFPGRVGIFTEVTNLMNISYQDIGNVIQPGRWIMAGIEIR